MDVLLRAFAFGNAGLSKTCTVRTANVFKLNAH